MKRDNWTETVVIVDHQKHTLSLDTMNRRIATKAVKLGMKETTWNTELRKSAPYRRFVGVEAQFSLRKGKMTRKSGPRQPQGFLRTRVLDDKLAPKIDPARLG